MGDLGFSRVLAALASAMLFALPATAQSLGVQGGLSVSHLDFTPPERGTDSDPGKATGIALGAYWVLTGHDLTAQVEAVYLQRGTRERFVTRVKTGYLEIPIGARLRFNRSARASVYAMAGTSVGFVLHSSEDANRSVLRLFTDIDQDISRTDVGLFAALGVDVGPMTFNGRYVRGHRDVNARRGDAYNRSLVLLMGVRVK